MCVSLLSDITSLVVNASTLYVVCFEKLTRDSNINNKKKTFIFIPNEHITFEYTLAMKIDDIESMSVSRIKSMWSFEISLNILHNSKTYFLSIMQLFFRVFY